jgi:hypothetical protein
MRGCVNEHEKGRLALCQDGPVCDGFPPRCTPLIGRSAVVPSRDCLALFVLHLGGDLCPERVPSIVLPGPL